jgi:palmitoyl-[glycerolipid] 3-(E)-desaturase
MNSQEGIIRTRKCVFIILQYLLLLQSSTSGFLSPSSIKRQQVLPNQRIRIKQGGREDQILSNRINNQKLNVVTLPEVQQQVADQGLIEDVYVDSTTTTTRVQVVQAKTWNDDGFVFGLQGSGLERPKGKVSLIVVDGDTLETKLYQQVMVGMTFIAHTFFVSSSFQSLLNVYNGNLGITVLQSVFLLLSSWILADFGSGVLHWSVDNYGNGRTPIMGSIIAAFQGHHTAPWTITQRGFCNNVYKLCIPFGIVPMTLISLIASPAITMFMAFFCIFEILSQEFHKWSHQLPSEVPAWVNVLQKGGLTVSRKQHAQHHLSPFDGNYCIISGVCNNVLDSSGFFRRLEHLIYNLNGVESNAWKLDSDLRSRTLSGDYSMPR